MCVVNENVVFMGFIYLFSLFVFFPPFFRITISIFQNLMKI